MNPLWAIPNFLMTAWQASLTQQQRDKYDRAVEQQIAEGRAGADAMQVAALNMISTNRDSAAAKQIYESIYKRIPAEARREIQSIGNAANRRRTSFLSDYDARTGQYLNQNDAATQAMLAELNSRNAAISGDYATREADVMALLEGQGDQALKDAELTFGQETERALGDLTSRGLSGSGVGASIRGGFASQKADELARIRERVGAQKAQALSGLRGDRLAFGERATNLGAGFTESGINRRLGAYSDVESARAAYDSAMSGDIADRRERALAQAYGLETGLGGQYADYLTGRADMELGTYLDTERYKWDLLNNIQNVPPDTSRLNQMAYSTGGFLGGFGD